MNIKKIFANTGPGFIVAATGLGAGDIVAAALAGAQFGTVLLWAVIIGAVLKLCLNEGLARWQLVTQMTFLEGWIEYLPRALSWYFLIYLLLWTFMVAGAMMAGTGLAAHAIFPFLPVSVWGIIHSLVALLLVWKGSYHILETMMKIFIGLMFVSIVCCAFFVLPPISDIALGIFVPSMPDNSLIYVVGIIGGVGGSVTIMSYGYWMREAGLTKPTDMAAMRLDLSAAYCLTALFGIAIILVSAGAQPEVVAGNNMAITIADQLGNVLGPAGKWIFLLGFWGAVFSSMIGVWHGVPYLFANFYHHFNIDKNKQNESNDSASKEKQSNITSSRAYKGYLLYLSLLPMSLAILDRPVWIIMLYAITGALFMPLLALLLLYMNSARKWLAKYKNGYFCKALLLLCLLLFGYLFYVQVQTQFA